MIAPDTVVKMIDGEPLNSAESLLHWIQLRSKTLAEAKAILHSCACCFRAEWYEGIYDDSMGAFQ